MKSIFCNKTKKKIEEAESIFRIKNQKSGCVCDGLNRKENDDIRGGKEKKDAEREEFLFYLSNCLIEITLGRWEVSRWIDSKKWNVCVRGGSGFLNYKFINN